VNSIDDFNEEDRSILLDFFCSRQGLGARKKESLLVGLFADNDKNLNVAVDMLPYVPGVALRNHLKELRSSQATSASNGVAPRTVTTEPSTTKVG
jgi:hypothetical protein